MAYMAPEVVDTHRRGYSWQVDWWSLGVSAFELLWHKRPFDGNTADKMRDSIINHPVKKPSHRHGVTSSECTSAIFGVSTTIYMVSIRALAYCLWPQATRARPYQAVRLQKWQVKH